MSNSRRGEVEVELGGKTYVLVFDFNSIAEIEERFDDRPINELLSSESGSVPMRVVREALRIGLDRRNRKMTSKEVGTLIGKELQENRGALLRIVKAIVGGVASAFGRTGEQEKTEEEGGEAVRPTEAPATGEG